MISFNTMSLTSIQIPVFSKFIFPAGISLLKLQLHIFYHLCDTFFNSVTKGSASSICLKLNLPYFRLLKTPGSFLYFCLGEWDYFMPFRNLKVIFNLFSAYVTNHQTLSILHNKHPSSIFCLSIPHAVAHVASTSSILSTAINIVFLKYRCKSWHTAA